MSFLGNFRHATKGTEAHPNHLIWAGLSALSAVVGKKLWLPMGHFNVYLNTYIVLVAPAGSRKSTALNFSSKMLEAIKGKPQLSLDSPSREALITTLKECEVAVPGNPPLLYTPYHLVVSELSELITTSKDHMIGLLTDLYDKVGPYIAKTQKRGTETITNPYICLLACCPPTFVSKKFNEAIITEGFGRRTVFVNEPDKTPRVAMPKVTQDMADAWTTAVRLGKEIALMRGEFQWEPEAFKRYEHWYTVEDANRTDRDARLASFYGTWHMLMLKVACLHSLSERRDLLITPDSIEFAIGLLNLVDKNLAQVFDAVGRNELHGVSKIMVDIVRAAGHSISERNLLLAMNPHATSSESCQILRYCLEAGRLVKILVPMRDGTDKFIELLATPDGKVRWEEELKVRGKKLGG